jgi:N6-L-threonylcarbamoyladenine synthase
VSSQTRLHEEYGGVVPELATREHLKNLPSIVNVALEQAGVIAGELDAIAATRGPGLPNALMTGLKFAQALAFSLNKPFVGVHHHEAHLYSPWIQGKPLRADLEHFQPNVSLIVSGGHTLLLSVSQVCKHQVLGGTLDDAAGECFDKIAKLLGLPYPGGPQLDRLARSGNPMRFAFPRPMLRDPGFDFSFSGLKTSVRYFLQKHPEPLIPGPDQNDLCASVQAAIVEVLVGKTMSAAESMRVRCVTASGGVSCNWSLRQQLTQECKMRGWELRLADATLCTDNAAMIGVLAGEKLRRLFEPESLDGEPQPNWPLEFQSH